MRWTSVLAAAMAAFLTSPSHAMAATPAAEQAFIAAFKAAYQAKDQNGIAALVRSEGANTVVVDFVLSMLTNDLGKGEVSLELKNLDPGELETATRAMPGPGGKLVKLSPDPYKKLVITVVIKNPNTTTTNTSSMYVIDEGSKVLIGVPADLK
jgi:hypothetical protein